MQRLKSRSQYQAVLGGRVVAKTSHFALHQLAVDPNDSSTSLIGSEDVWLGAMAPKRWAKRAVTRNMIKRQIYCVVSQVELPLAAYLVRLRAEFNKAQFVSATSMALKAAVKHELRQLLDTARSLGPSRPHVQQHPPQLHPPQVHRPVSLKQAAS